MSTALGVRGAAWRIGRAGRVLAALLLLAAASSGPQAVIASGVHDLPQTIARWCATSFTASALALLIGSLQFGRTLAVVAQATVFAALATCSVAMVYVAVWWRFADAASGTLLVNTAAAVLAVALIALAVARDTYRSAPMRRFFHGRPDRRDLTRQMALLAAACIAMATLNTWLFAKHAVAIIGLQPGAPASAVDAAIAQAFGLRAWYVAATVATLLTALTLVNYRRNSPAARELRLDAARAQATLEEIAHAVLTVDAQGHILSANRGAEALFGEAPHTLLGASLATRLTPVAPIAGGEGGTDSPPGLDLGAAEHLVRRPDGAEWPVSVVSRRFVFDEQTLYALIVRDLRADKHASAMLARWEQVFVNAGWGVAVIAPDLQSLGPMNPEFARMHGWPRDQLLGQTPRAFVAPAAWADLQQHLVASATQGPQRFETWLVHRDGSEFPALVDATSVRDAAGALLFHVVNVRDMSTQMAAREALERSEALLNLVLDSLPVGVCVADRHGNVVRTNAALEAQWRGDAPPGVPPPPSNAIRRAARKGVSYERTVVEIDRPDGAHRVVLHSATPLRGADGTLQGAVSVTEDITAISHAQRALRRTKVFFETVFKSAAVGMVVLDDDGSIIRTNAAFCRLVGRDKRALLRTPFVELLHPSERQAHLERRATLAAGKMVAYPMERRLLQAGSMPLWVSLAVAMVGATDDGRPQYIVQTMNIDDSHRMRESLIASEVRLANAQRIARLGDWVWEPDTDFVRCSLQAWWLLGLVPSVLRQLSREEFLARMATEHRGAVVELLEQARAGLRPRALDHRLLTPDGSTRLVQQQVEAERDEHGVVQRVVGTLQDVTERKRIELELERTQHLLRALAAHGDERLEEERKHIAREVHDELGGLVTALRMELSMLRGSLRGQAELLAQADSMRGLLDRSVGVLREVTQNLRPGALDVGLTAALEWLAEDFSARADIPCTVRVECGELALPDAVATAAFRVVQESLTNVARHAGASRVEIVMRRDGKTVSLSITDDGCGFDTGTDGVLTGFGLLGMRERMRSIGGRMNVASDASGTTIRIEFPLP